MNAWCQNAVCINCVIINCLLLFYFCRYISLCISWIYYLNARATFSTIVSPRNPKQYWAVHGAPTRSKCCQKKKKHLTCCRRRRENWRERDSHSLFRLEPNILKSCLRSAFAILLILIFVIYFQRFGCCSLFVNSQQPA